MNKVRTPLLDVAARELIYRMHVFIFGCRPSDNRLEMLWTHLGIEHGACEDTTAPHDGRAVWNCFDWDLGNRRGIDGDHGSFQMTAGEIINGHEVQIGGKWPSFSGADMGMATWLLMLKRRYASAWEASDHGDPATYAAALKAKGYYTAALDRYTAGLRTWQAIYRRHTSWPDLAGFDPIHDTEPPPSV